MHRGHRKTDFTVFYVYSYSMFMKVGDREALDDSVGEVQGTGGASRSGNPSLSKTGLCVLTPERATEASQA